MILLLPFFEELPCKTVVKLDGIVRLGSLSLHVVVMHFPFIHIVSRIGNTHCILWLAADKSQLQIPKP
jgi:hypothetical protein